MKGGCEASSSSGRLKHVHDTLVIHADDAASVNHENALVYMVQRRAERLSPLLEQRLTSPQFIGRRLQLRCLRGQTSLLLVHLAILTLKQGRILRLTDPSLASTPDQARQRRSQMRRRSRQVQIAMRDANQPGASAFRPLHNYADPAL